MTSVVATFTGGTSTTSLGSADTGQVFTADIGTWGRISDHAYCPTPAGGVNMAHCTTSADGTASVDLSSSDAGHRNGSLMFRRSDNNNYWIVELDSVAASIILYKVVAGAATNMGSYSTAFAQTTVYTIAAVLSGPSIDIYFNGTSRITISDAFNQTATTGFARGYHGSGIDLSKTIWDNYSFTDVPAVVAPSAKVEIELTAGAWTDISDYLVEASIHRGRAYDLDRIDAGTAMLALENDGRFTPELATGAYYPNILPRKRLRITDSTSTAQVFQGRVERWSPRLEDGSYHYCVVTVVDESKFLGTEINPVALAEILLDSPTGVWPLDEASGAAYGANHSPVSTSPFARLAIAGESPSGSFGAPGLVAGLPGSTGLAYAGFDAHGASNAFTATAGTGLSVEAWITQAPVTADYVTMPVLLDVVGPGGAYLRWTFDGGTFQPLITSSGGTVFAFPSGGSALADGRPHHIAMTLATDKRTVRYYIDGVYGGTTSTLAADLDIPGGSVYASPGVSATVGVSTSLVLGMAATFPTRLSDARVTAHYTAGLGAAGETEAARITRILAYAGWTGTSTLDSGISTLGACPWTYGASAWEQAQRAASDAGGLLFISRTGAATYHNRDRRYLATTSALTLKESTGTAVNALGFDLSEQGLVNDVTVIPTSGNQARYVDTTSVTAYGTTAITEDSSLGSDDEAYQRAHYLARVHGAPTTQVEAVPVSLTTLAVQATMNAAVAADVSTRITLAELPAVAPWSSRDFFVEGVDHAISRTERTWDVTYNVSQAVNAAVWIIGDATFGAIGSYAPAY